MALLSYYTVAIYVWHPKSKQAARQMRRGNARSRCVVYPLGLAPVTVKMKEGPLDWREIGHRWKAKVTRPQGQAGIARKQGCLPGVNHGLPEE